MNKIFPLIIAGLVLCFLTALLVSASLGTFQQETEIQLIQTCNNCTYCHITSILYPNNTDIAESYLNMTQRTSTFFNYTLNKENTTVVGVYQYCYDCGNAVESLTGCITFDVTSTGEKVSLSNIIIVITFLILAGVFLVLAWSFNKEHWILKTFFNFCAVLMGILAVNSARIIASESTNLGIMGAAGLMVMIVVFSIFFIYMFVYTFIEIIKALREKRGVRWKF